VEVYQAGSFGTWASTPVSLSFFYWFQKLKKDRDILHIHMPFPLADLALWLFGFQGKVVLWWHSDIVRQRKLLTLYRPLLRRTLNRADVVITATQGHIDGSEFLPACRDKCVVIPYGADKALLADSDKACRGQARPAETAAEQDAEGYNYAFPPKLKSEPAMTVNSAQNNPVTFLFVGRLVYYKGCDILLEAFAQIRGAAQLAIIGSGPLEPALKAKAAQLGLSETVSFQGYLDDEAIRRHLADCDIFVLPSIAKTEAFGLVQLEAMAYGKPVINTQLPGGVPWVSPHGVTGLTVPPGDAAALATAMQTLADDPALRRQLGQAACRRVREEYRLEAMLDQIHAVYRRLAAAAP
jgi:rhamnosyl/mannosyltransferase